MGVQQDPHGQDPHTLNLNRLQEMLGGCDSTAVSAFAFLQAVWLINTPQDRARRECTLSGA